MGQPNVRSRSTDDWSSEHFLRKMAKFIIAQSVMIPPAPIGHRTLREIPYLHPTKGWRGIGTRPRGTNLRRVRT